LSFKPEKKERKGNNYLKGLKMYWGKFQRLIIPMIFGTFIIVLPTKYIGREYAPLKRNGDPRAYTAEMSFF